MPPIRRRRATGLITEGTDLNTLLAFSFGVIFVTAMLVFAVFVPSPTAFAQWVFITVLALASAGIGAVLPGMLHIDLPYARAGGALALFLLVFSTKPAIINAVTVFSEPSASPLPVMQSYLKDIDAGKIDEALDQLDDEAKNGLSSDRENIRTIYRQARSPLGEVEVRELFGSSRYVSPQGYPPGIYRIIGFRTKFNSGKCYSEQVSARAVDEKQWKVYDHVISPMPVPCSA